MNCLCYNEKYSGETRLIKQTRTRETDLFAATAILSTLRFPILLHSLPLFPLLSFFPPFFSPSAFSRRDQRDGPTEYEQGKEEKGGIFIVNVKRARRVTRLRLIPTPPPNHSRNHSTFFTSRFSLDRYKNSIASGKKRIPTVSHLSGAGRGWPISKSKGTNATRILLLFHDFFFLHFFHFFFFTNRDDC